MTRKELEDFITHLDHESEDMCVYPYKQTNDCGDCYECRVDYFDWVRKDMIER